MAENKKADIEEDLEDKAGELKAKGVKSYEKLIDQLYEQRNNLRKQVDSQYNEGRRYVRANPESGLLLGFVSGVVLGIMLGRTSK
jgi:ElaB/YqjD/DUF883 family membrane-anchored ribosome-binding protein